MKRSVATPKEYPCLADLQQNHGRKTLPQRTELHSRRIGITAENVSTGLRSAKKRLFNPESTESDAAGALVSVTSKKGGSGNSVDRNVDRKVGVCSGNVILVGLDNLLVKL